MIEQVHVVEVDVERAAAGEDNPIAQAGAPPVSHATLPVRTEPRQLGQLKGQIWYGPYVDEDLTNDFNCLRE